MNLNDNPDTTKMEESSEFETIPMGNDIADSIPDPSKTPGSSSIPEGATLGRTIEVVAPTDLKAGYQFQVDSGNNKTYLVSVVSAYLTCCTEEEWSNELTWRFDSYSSRKEEWFRDNVSTPLSYQRIAVMATTFPMDAGVMASLTAAHSGAATHSSA